MRLCLVLLGIVMLPVSGSAVVLHAGDILVFGYAQKCQADTGYLMRIDPIAEELTCMFPLVDAQALEMEGTGSLLAATGSGLLRIDVATGQQAVVYPGGVTSPVVEDSDSVLWALGGLYRIDLTSGSISGIPAVGATGCYALTMDQNGKVYCPYMENSQPGYDGIIRIDRSSRTQTILSSDGDLDGSIASGIAIAPSGEILVVAHYPITPGVYQSPFTARLIGVDPVSGVQRVVSQLGPSRAAGSGWDDIDATSSILVIDGSEDGLVYRVNPVTGDRTSVIPGADEASPVFDPQLVYDAIAIEVVPGNLPDSDQDGTADGYDNCPIMANPDQSDRDGNHVGDACNDSEDPDGDEWASDLDNCPDVANADQADADGDGLGDSCDPFPTQADHVLAQALADLEQAQVDLAAAQLALAEAESELAATQEALAECQDQLAQCLDTEAGERGSRCGLGWELAIVLPLLVRARKARGRRTVRAQG